MTHKKLNEYPVRHCYDKKIVATGEPDVLVCSKHYLIPAPVANAADAVIESAGNLADSYIQGFGEMGILKAALDKYREVTK